jgi:replication-associated recombination protein RarA
MGKLAHRTTYDSFRHVLGGRLTTKTIQWIESMVWQGFSARQVMQLHQEHVVEAAQQGVQPTRDTFIMLDDIHNISKKRVQELYQKHKNDILRVHMWTEENCDFIFIY